MTKKQKEEKLNAIKNCLREKGWVEDRYGNFIKETKGVKKRMKFNATSLRHEKQIVFEATKYTEARKEWIRLNSAYYKDIEVVEIDGEHFIKGLK